MKPRPGMEPSSRDSYELLEVTVDGHPQSIRRTARTGGQTYTVHLDETARKGEPVRIRQVFRTVTPNWSHRLYFELPQPARNMAVSLDYTNTTIADMRVIESVATTRPTQLSRSSERIPGRTLSVEAIGWLLPKTGFTFTWTLDTELPRGDERREAA